jgi:hypothetical protein
MTNEQLYLAVGLPIVFNVVFNGVLFLALNSRMTSLESRFESRIGGLETRFDSRIDGLETRMTNLEQSTSAKFDLVVGAIHDLDNRVSRLWERFERK